MTLDQLVQLMDPQLYLHLRAADSTNFFFFFRMLLVWYKREFEWVDVLRLWESLWTDWLSSSFHLFIALAILEKHRDVIMNHLKHFDEVLKYSMSISLFDLLLHDYLFSDFPGIVSDLIVIKNSQRALKHDRFNPYSQQSRSTLSPFRENCPGYRQEEQFPSSSHSSQKTRIRSQIAISTVEHGPRQ